MSTAVKPIRHKCRHKFCFNRYDDVIGGDGAFGKKKTGAECMPCFYASSLIENELTPERVEGNSQFMAEMLPHLERTGWTWQDVKDAYLRMKDRDPQEFLN